jgi:hypothetical protein
MQQLATLTAILLLFLNVILQPIIVRGQRLFTPEKADSLKAVTVNGRKPPVEVKADRTIVNVEGTINSVGQNVLDILRKSPGITVDKDDNISLSGKNGVKIYIDGRQVPLNGTDLADYLKTLPVLRDRIHRDHLQSFCQIRCRRQRRHRQHPAEKEQILWQQWFPHQWLSCRHPLQLQRRPRP